MIDHNIYSGELIEVLNDNIFGGSIEHSDLRIIYNDILNSIMNTSLFENNTQIPVKLTSIDREFVTQTATIHLDRKKNDLYSAEAIIKTLNEHFALINDKIKSETSLEIDSLKLVGKRSIGEFLTIEEFRKRAI